MFSSHTEMLDRVKKKKNINSSLIERYQEKPIAYNPTLAKISGKATDALFICQLLYWQGRGKDKNWIYKTIEECKKETWLSRSEQDRAIRRWVELGVLKVERRGRPQKRFFSVDMGRLEELLEENYRNSNLPIPAKSLSGSAI